LVVPAGVPLVVVMVNVLLKLAFPVVGLGALNEATAPAGSAVVTSRFMEQLLLFPFTVTATS
jgi:hypothetical protein